MAPRLKAGGVKPKPKKAKKPKGASARPGKNTMSAEDAADEFETIFDLHKKLETVSGEIRKEIADQYATCAKRLDVAKKLVKHTFGLEKHRRAIAKIEAEFDGRDRDGLMKLAQIFGEDSSYGEFALRASNRAKRDDFGGEHEDQVAEDDEGGGDSPEAGED